MIAATSGVAALMLRFPDGQRFTRRFLETHTFKVHISSLASLAISHLLTHKTHISYQDS